MKIVVLDGHTLNPGDLSWDALAALGTLRVHERSKPEDVVPRAQHAEAVLTNKVPLNRETIRHLTNLKYIGVLATGHNVVNGEAARKRGVVVTNVPGYATPSVVQHVFALLLEFSEPAPLRSRRIRRAEPATSSRLKEAGVQSPVLFLEKTGSETIEALSHPSAQASATPSLTWDSMSDPSILRSLPFSANTTGTPVS